MIYIYIYIYLYIYIYIYISVTSQKYLLLDYFFHQRVKFFFFFMHTVSHPDKTSGHLFSTGMLHISHKKMLNVLILV